MIGQDSAEGSFNLISTSKELLHPDLLWNKAQSMIVSLKRIFDTMCMYPTKTKLSGQRQDANLTALTCNGVRWWWRLIGVEMMDPFFCSQSLMLSLVTSVHIYIISKCKDYAPKKTTSHRCFVDDREVLTLLIHTGSGILVLPWQISWSKRDVFPNTSLLSVVCGYNITWVMDSFKQFDKTWRKLQVLLVERQLFSFMKTVDTQRVKLAIFVMSYQLCFWTYFDSLTRIVNSVLFW